MSLPTPADGAAPGYFGVYPAVVTRIAGDPQKLGRVQLRFPWLGADGNKRVRPWATLCSPYADDDQGLQIMPARNSHVVVAFEAGILTRPYILGAAWHRHKDRPFDPQETNNIRVLRSRAKSKLEFDDTQGRSKVSITMSSGHQVVLDDSVQQITVQHSNKTTVIRLNSRGGVEITASEVEITAPQVKVTAAVSTFTGVVKCLALKADAAISSPVYTTGAGNFL
ncbi:phage baseplate assembly protein V [Actinoplanes solisilvae]|uniref:phage baseplate assembly protein V n=1 Tax=Actinoplanes solisilvae TaxID=2486853 RepID=UPI000FD90E26|nr:phage baseplate assembly protein V [Actinoplanes solisilvae]